MKRLATTTVALLCALALSVAPAHAAFVGYGDLYAVDSSLAAVGSSSFSSQSSGGGVVANLDETLSLASTGDYVELSFLMVRNGAGNNQQNKIRFGLFNNAGTAVTGDAQTGVTDDWIGYFPSLVSRNSGSKSANIWQQSTGTDNILDYDDGSPGGSGVGAVGSSKSSGINTGTVNAPMKLRIERTASGIDISGGPFEFPEDGTTLHTVSDGTPVTLDYNGFALHMGDDFDIANIAVESNVVSTPAPPPGPGAGDPFVLLENFEGSSAGTDIDDLPNWSASGADRDVVADPDDASNLVGFVGNRSIDVRLQDPTIEVLDNGAATLFSRVRFGQLSDSDELPFGMVVAGEDTPAAGARGESGQIETTGGAQSTDILGQTWYNLWLVADHEADLVTLYLQSDLDPNFLTQTQVFVAPFDSADFNPGDTLSELVWKTGNKPDTVTMWLDDLYWSANGVNLDNPLEVTDAPVPEPMTMGMVLLAGAALLARRRTGTTN